MSDIDLINSLSDRDIVVFLYHRCLNCKIEEIARIRNLTLREVRNCIKNAKASDQRLEAIAAIRSLFCESEK
jgi:DNA-directed RNA polymerase specialized sigma24 family protein